MRTLLSALLWGGSILLVGGAVCCQFSLTSMFAGLVAAGCGLAAISLAAVLAFLTMLMLFKIQLGLVVYLLLGCSPLLAALWLMGPDSLKLPLIHDISTDTVNPPDFEFARVGRERQGNSLNYEGHAVSEQQRLAYPQIEPMIVARQPLELLPLVERTAKSLGWKLIGSDELMLRVEAQERSMLFGFVDDVVIRLSDTRAGSRVDVRSVSRMGQGDFGANAARIQRFYRALCAVPGLSCKTLQDIESSAEKAQKSVDSFSSDS